MAAAEMPEQTTEQKPLEIKACGMEHCDELLQKEHYRNVAQGDKVKLLAEVDGANEGETIKFELYYSTGNGGSTHFATVSGAIKNGIGSAEWTADLSKPLKVSDTFDLKHEPVVRGKYGKPCPIGQRAEFILLEFVYPAVYNPDSPHKQYVNLDSNGKNEGGELEIRVRPRDLNAAVKDTLVYWKVTAHEENSKRTEPKTGIKPYDTNSQLRELTDRVATCSTEFVERDSSIMLVCGVAGGDRFTVEVGSDGENYPLKVLVENWRRIWYQYTHEESMSLPSLKQFQDAYNRVFIEPQISTTVMFSKDQTPDRTYYPEWMLSSNNSNRELAVIGNHNKQHFYDMFEDKPSKKPNAHLIVCQSAWDIGRTSRPRFIAFKQNVPQRTEMFYLLDREMEELAILKPALAGTLVVSGEWVHPFTGRRGSITDDNITIPRSRTSLNIVEVSLPENAPTPTRNNPVNVTLTLRGADGPYLGECNGSKLLAVYTGPVDFNNTIAHEIGHAVNQVPLPSRVPPGLVAHPRQYTGHGGIGSHCNTVITVGKHTTGVVVNGIYRTGICVMFHAGDSSCINRFCDICESHLKASDCSDFRRI